MRRQIAQSAESGDSIDSDWKQESDVSSDDTFEESESIHDLTNEDEAIIISAVKAKTDPEPSVKKPRKKRESKEPPLVWNAPSDLDELDICSDLDGKTGKRKYNAETRIRVLHPEIGTVWRDLKKNSSDFKLELYQPTDVTLKLLPFQLEGVSWLKHQEDGIFHGGILADEMV